MSIVVWYHSNQGDDLTQTFFWMSVEFEEWNCQKMTTPQQATSVLLQNPPKLKEWSNLGHVGSNLDGKIEMSKKTGRAIWAVVKIGPWI